MHACPEQRSGEDQTTGMKDISAKGDREIKDEVERY